MASTITINNLTNNDIMYRNFEGIQKENNNAGQRNFVVKLTNEQATELQKSGHYIKMSKPDRDGNQYPYVQVKVNMDSKWPPMFEIFTNKGRVEYGADEIKALDRANIVGADIVLNSYLKSGGDHYTLYLREFHAAIKDPDNSKKYLEMLKESGLDNNDDDDDMLF